MAQTNFNQIIELEDMDEVRKHLDEGWEYVKTEKKREKLWPGDEGQEKTVHVLGRSD